MFRYHVSVLGAKGRILWWSRSGIWSEVAAWVMDDYVTSVVAIQSWKLNVLWTYSRYFHILSMTLHSQIAWFSMNQTCLKNVIRVSMLRTGFQAMQVIYEPKNVFGITAPLYLGAKFSCE